MYELVGVVQILQQRLKTQNRYKYLRPSQRVTNLCPRYIYKYTYIYICEIAQSRNAQLQSTMYTLICTCVCGLVTENGMLQHNVKLFKAKPIYKLSFFLWLQNRSWVGACHFFCSGFFSKPGSDFRLSGPPWPPLNLSCDFVFPSQVPNLCKVLLHPSCCPFHVFSFHRAYAVVPNRFVPFLCAKR